VSAVENVEKAGNAGYQDRHMEAIFKQGLSFSGFERDMLWLNLGTRKVLDISGLSGIDSISDARGSLFADFDNDGDLDVFMVALQGEGHHLFRNNVGQDHGFLRVTLEGTKSGRDAYGAIVRVGTSAGTLTKIKAGGSGYLSQSDPRLLFGLGSDAEAAFVEVTWPGGAKQRFERVPAGTSMNVVEGREGYQRIAEKRFRLPDPPTSEEAVLAKLAVAKGAPFPNIALRRPGGGAAVKMRSLMKTDRRCLVNLWATWCTSCSKEMPELQKLYAPLREAGVDLVGLSLDAEAAPVPGYLKAKGIKYPVYVAGEDAAPKIFANGQMVLPMSVLLDARGRIMEVFSGWSERTRRELERLASKPAAAASPLSTMQSGAR